MIWIQAVKLSASEILWTVYIKSFTVMSAFLKGCAVFISKILKKCIFWMASDRCGPSGVTWLTGIWSYDMLHQRSAWNTQQPVTDIYLNHFMAHLLRLMHSELFTSQMESPSCNQIFNSSFAEYLGGWNIWRSNIRKGHNDVIVCNKC